MRNLFAILICLMPALSFAAVDVSDCEVIGYQKGKMVEKDCVTIESCKSDFANFPEDLKTCLKYVKSPTECVEYIAAQNANMEKNNLVYKCPANKLRLEQRAKPKDHTNHDLVYNNGKAMDLKALASDNRYVYLFHEKVGLPGFLSMGGYSIIGPAEKYGLNMVAFEE